MDNWQRQELDKLTCGEVALQVFGAQRTVDEAAAARAEAASVMWEVRSELEKAEKKFSEASQLENEALREHAALKKYLNERLHFTP